MLRRLVSGFALGCLLLAAGAAQAQTVLYSAYSPDRTSGWCTHLPTSPVAVKFSVPASGSFDITGIKANVWITAALVPENIRLDVFEWVQDDVRPANLVGSLTLNETLPQADPDDIDYVSHDYTFSPSQPLRLEAGRNYWVQYNVTTYTQCDVYVGRSRTAPTTSVLIREAEYSNWDASGAGNHGPWQSYDSSIIGYAQLEIYGREAPVVPPDDTAGAVPAVPVPVMSPMALILLAMGMASGAIVVIRGRRRRGD